jgi:hypothetical protein
MDILTGLHFLRTSFLSVFLFTSITGEINVEAGLGPKFEILEKDLKGEGLTAMVEKIEVLRKSIAENILADMNKNR